MLIQIYLHCWLFSCSISNLSAAEDRIKELESIISSLVPGVALDSVLGSLQQIPRATARQESKAAEETSSQAGPVSIAASGVESLPREAHGFDWAEHELPLGGLADGMAALSINPAGAGYLGMQEPDLTFFDTKNTFRCNIQCSAPKSTLKQGCKPG